MAVAKEQIRQIISENNISSVADVYTLLKDSFKDILQELMEAELDATLDTSCCFVTTTISHIVLYFYKRICRKVSFD